MASGGANFSSSTSSSATSESNLSNFPMWKHVTVLGKTAERGGNTQFRCNFCNSPYHGSYPRVRAHLLKIKGQGIKVCEKVTGQAFKELQHEDALAQIRIKASQPIDVSLPSQVSTVKRKKSPLEKSLNIEGRALVDEEMARLFYSSGLPFNVSRNPHYYKVFRLLDEPQIRGYVPPSYNSLRTTLLAKEKAHIERCLRPLKESWIEKGVSIASDGWTDTQRRPLINFIAVSESGPMFLKAVNCEGEYKDKYFIANQLKEAIEQVGPKNVVQVVTDNAPVCKAAGRIIEGQYPHIFWTPCVVHSLNLALKSICAAKNTEANGEVYAECHWIKEVADKAFQIKNFIVNHNMRLAMYNEHAHLKLLSIAETRFASVIIMLRRLKEMRQALSARVISSDWNSYREDNVAKAQEVKRTILDDLWWDNVEYILEFTSPLYDMLRFADTDKPSLHLVFGMWDSMIENVKKVIYRHDGKEYSQESSFYKVVHEILVKRWTKSSSPVHCLAHSLNPRYYSRSWLDEDQKRVAPHRDLEITNERNKCFFRLYPDVDARSAIQVEFAKFSGMLGGFGQHDSMEARTILDPLMWWHIYGLEAPNLQALAFKLLQQPSSSSCCERNWSTFIVSLRRNKLLPQRADDLVFVHNNLRLLSRNSNEYKTGPTKLWDIGGDAFELSDAVDTLEFAELSLDEPELEAMIFVGGVDNNYRCDDTNDDMLD